MTVISNYCVSLLKQAIIFSSFRRYRNLSRVDPKIISTGVGSSNYFHPVGGGEPYVFTSVILVSSCHLVEAKNWSTGRKQKFVEGACIEGEYERLVGCIGQIIRLRLFKGQIVGGNISFSTAFSSSNDGMLPLYVYVLVSTLVLHSVVFILYFGVSDWYPKLLYTWSWRSCFFRSFELQRRGWVVFHHNNTI